MAITLPIQRTGISLDVPGQQVSVQQAGLVGEGLSSLGAGLAQTSAEIYAQINEQAARTEAAKLHEEEVLALDTKRRELQAQSQGGMVLVDDKKVPIADAFQSWSEDRFKEKQKSLSSKRAQEFFTSSVRPIYTSGLVQMRGYQNEQRILQMAQDEEDIIRVAGTALEKSPDINVFYASRDHITSTIQGSMGTLRNAEQVKEAQSRAEQQLSNTFFNSGLTRVADAMAKGDKALGKSLAQFYISELNDARGSAAGRRKLENLKSSGEMLPKDKRADYKQAFLQHFRQAETFDSSEYNTLKAIYQTKLEGAAPGEKVVINPVVAMAVDGFKKKKLSALEAGRDIYSLYGKDAINQFANTADIAFLPEGEVVTRINSLAKDIVTRAKEAVHKLGAPEIAAVLSEEDAKNTMLSSARRLLSNRDDDTFAHTIKNSPSVGAVWGSIDTRNPEQLAAAVPLIAETIKPYKNYYKQMHPGNNRYYRIGDKKTNAEVAETILKSDNFTSSKLLFSMANRAPEWLNQIINDGKLDPVFSQVARFSAGGEGRLQEALALMKGEYAKGKDVETDFKNWMEARGDSVTDFIQKTPKEILSLYNVAYSTTQITPELRSNITLFNDLIKRKAMTNKMGGLNDSDSWKRAAEWFLLDLVSFDNVKGSPLMYSKVPADQETAIKTYFEQFSDEKFISSLKLHEPITPEGEKNYPEWGFSRYVSTGSRNYVEAMENGVPGFMVYFQGYKSRIPHPLEIDRGTPMFLPKDYVVESGFSLLREKKAGVDKSSPKGAKY